MHEEKKFHYFARKVLDRGGSGFKLAHSWSRIRSVANPYPGSEEKKIRHVSGSRQNSDRVTDVDPDPGTKGTRKILKIDKKRSFPMHCVFVIINYLITFLYKTFKLG